MLDGGWWMVADDGKNFDRDEGDDKGGDWGRETRISFHVREI